MGNKNDREARNQWETEVIARFVMVAKLRQIQVRLTTIRDQGQTTTQIAIGKQRSLPVATLHAQMFRCPLEI